jgi:hypothetical protein
VWLVAGRLPVAGAQQDQAAVAGRWEIEVHGGATLASTRADGTGALPPPGAPLTTSTPTFPTRHVPSWFFGDGAALLNGVNASFGLPARVVPLDAGLTSPDLDVAGRFALGLRVRRELTSRFSVEAGFETSAGASSLSDVLESTADSTRESFEAAMRALLSSGPFSDVDVQATRSTGNGSQRDVAVSLALNVHVRRFGRFEPYLTAGGAILSRVGTGPAMVLESRYRFTVDGTLPIEESDRVVVRARRDQTAAAIAGGGVRRALSDRWSLRIDARVFVGPGGHRLEIDATPSTTHGSPAGFVESFTHPSVQFSNDPSTGRQSSLGAPLQSFEVFKSDGIETRLVLAVGLSRRF